MEKLEWFDQRLFLFLNGCHNPFWDVVMYWMSDIKIWIPFYLFLIFLIFKNYRKQGWLILAFIILLIILSDQSSVHLFKNVFMRLRPCHYFPDGVVHVVNGHCGGQYSFVSSHAANTFAMATFVSYILKPYYKIFKYILFVWAAIISYSRVYLGVHFPGDILGGALLGIFIGYFVTLVYRFVKSRYIHPKANQS